MRVAALFAFAALVFLDRPARVGESPRDQQSKSPTLAEVMARASRFAERQRDALASMRGDEHYRQELVLSDGRSFQARTLLSEIAFVQMTVGGDWLAFRNVTSVDGVATGTDPGRLEKLFRSSAADGQWRRILEENAIYNIGRLQRTFNIPTLPLHLLLPQHLDRFRFKRIADKKSDDESVWVIEYKEHESPTIVRAIDRKDVPLDGRLWIAPDDGRLLRATLHANVPIQTEVEFTWRHDSGVDTWVPAEMRERYRRILDEKSPPRMRRYYDIVAVATYTNFKRFGVDVRIK